MNNLVEKTDRNGRVTQYDYDDLHRLVEERWKNGGSTVHTINWTYDVASQLSEVADSFAEYDYTYDGLGRATSIVADIAGLTPVVTLAQQFDANGNRKQLATTIGSTADFQTDFSYDYLNRLKRVTQQAQGSGTGFNALADKRVDLSYHADGQFNEINRYASLNTSEFVAKSTYGYDDTGRLTSLTHAQGGTTFAGYGWTFDAANRITAFTNSQYAAEDATYSYDDASQLIGVDRTGSINDEAYDYDDNGNRETANGDTYTTTANNRMSSDGTFTYTYDDEGNTLTKVRISNDPADDKTVEYTWDHRNRLTSVTFKNNAGTVTQKLDYIYDAFDRYIVRRHDTDGDTDIDESTNFIFDGQHVALALDDAGNVQNRYLHGPAVDMVLADEQVGDDLLWLLADNQGTIRDLASYDAGTDTTTVENHRTYSSFGKITNETNAAVDSIFAYTGRILDEATGDQNHRARWYDADTGRWLSEDPIKDGTNWGAYANNSPSNLVDYTGLEPVGSPIWLYELEEKKNPNPHKMGTPEWEELAMKRMA